MSTTFFSRSSRTKAALSLLALLSLGVSGCTTTNSDLRDAHAANLASETALNAQIMSDRARDQRCLRDPSRRECGPY